MSNATGAAAAPPKYRPLTFGVTRVNVRGEDGGVQHLAADVPLQPFGERMSDRLVHWAKTTPDETFVAQRERLTGGQLGDWRRVSYAQTLDAARRIGQALIDRGLSQERPVVILSDNGIDHALLALGCIYAGIPFSPASPAYSTISKDYGKLRHVIDKLTPGLIWAEDGERYGPALAATAPTDCEIAVSRHADHPNLKGRKATLLSELLATEPTPAVDAARQATTPDTIVKFLFTSGSTKLPKAVINTNRMICANQQMIRQCLRFLAEEPPVLVDWLPWNHTFGGNHNVGIVLYNGGTLHIDEGKPTPKGIAETLRNLREISPTVYFNVPKGFEEIATAMETDEQLRRTLFARVRAFMFAGAGLSQAVWDRLETLAEATVGERIRIITGLGMTETAPSCTFAVGTDVRSGWIGLPVPGVEVKLVRDGAADDPHAKTEIRFSGPNVMPAYWRAPQQTSDAFDADGFYRTGDAVRFIDPAHPNRGLVFDGRTAEDFKLSTGTFVSVGPLRARVTLAGAPSCRTSSSPG